MSKKILMVDDDEELCQEMAEILEGEGYAIQTVFNGLEGERLSESGNYDLLILDMKLPGATGLEILKNAKEKKISSKIILSTGSLGVSKILKEGKIDPSDPDAATFRLADVLVSKPFDVVNLLQKIQSLIG